MGLASIAALSVACVPSSGDPGTRSASELGLHVAREVAPTTVAPAPPADPVAPVTTTAPSPLPAAPSPAAPPGGSFITPGARSGIAGCPLFPRDNVFHATVTGLARRPDSDRMVAAAGASLPIKTFFSSGIWQGSRLGIPINTVDAASERKDLIVGINDPHRSDQIGVPWPNEPRFEGWPGRAWDKHLVVVDPAVCRSWELINVQPPSENLVGALINRWYADSVVSIDLQSNEPRPYGTVTASGVSLIAGLVRYDEVAAGAIDHVMTMTLPVIRHSPPVWPAQGSDGRSADPAAPQMGTWFRLKPSTDLRGLGPQAVVVARALQEHGAIVVDSGPNAAISGEPDLRWNDADLAGLGRLTLSDFDAVDPSPMKVADGSFRIRDAV